MSDSFNPMDCSPPGSSVHGIFRARILEWVDISFSSIPGYVSGKKKKAMIFKKCALIFIAALFTIAKILKLPKWLSAEG